MSAPAQERRDAILARVLATQIIGRVLEGRYLDDALNEARAQPGYAPLVQELVYGTLRWYHRLQGIARLFLTRPLKPKDSDIGVLLLLGLYQLLFTRVAAHAAVDITVACADALGKTWAKALLNACLRSAQRESTRIDATIRDDEELRYSHPRWLIDAIRRDHPHAWQRILDVNNERPPLTLRVNQRHTTRDAYLERLRSMGMAAAAHASVDSAIVVTEAVPVDRLPGFADGDVSVQDAAAQLAAILMDAKPGDRVLDACAAPGGKAAHLLERTPGLALTAIEIDRARRERADAGLVRLRLDARVVAGDATEPASWWDGEPFDQILVDAPCSATGVIRRHPDIKLRRQPDELSQLTHTQAQILNGVWPCLKSGGKLWYATCSVLRDENQQQIREFIRRHPDVANGADTWERQIIPGDEGMDGFYYACLRKC